MNYSEIAAGAKTEELAWMNSPEGKLLSDELDRVKKINPYWLDMYHEHGRHTACMELSWSILSMECDHLRQTEREAREKAEAPLKNFEFENWIYLRDRCWCARTEDNVAYIWREDAKFIEKQRATGFSVDELEREIARRQKSEAENLAWTREKARRDAAAEADKRRIKDEADRKQADLFAKAVRTEVEKLVKDIIASGVLSHGK
jgi:hypothetical protein